MSALELAFTFLSGVTGGLVVKLLDWLQFTEGFRTQQRIEFLKQQVADLYGPLYLLARQNQQLTQLSSNINAAYTAEYCDVKWSADRDTQESISKEAKTTIDVNNRYASQMVANTKAMRDIIRKNLWMSEADDRAHFEKIVEDMTRLETELDSELKIDLPYRIILKLDNICFSRGDVLQHLIAKYTTKREALDEMRQSKWPRFVGRGQR